MCFEDRRVQRRGQPILCCLMYPGKEEWLLSPLHAGRTAETSSLYLIQPSLCRSRSVQLEEALTSFKMGLVLR